MNNKTPPQVPSSQVKTLVGGVALIAGGIACWWYGLLRYGARREERGDYTPWEYRILQAQAAAGNPDRPSMSRESRDKAASPPERSGSMPAPRPPSEPDAGTESWKTHAEQAAANTPQTKSNGSSASDPNAGQTP